MNARNVAALTIAAMVLGACTQHTPQVATASDAAPAPSAPKDILDQNNLCEVSGWQHDVAKAECEPGQKIVFLPKSWGNEQLPILFAAVNCDLRYSVALTTGGVTCIYAPINLQPDPMPLPGPVRIPQDG